MEVMMPIDDDEEGIDDFDFNSGRSSPYPSAPSTPRGFGNSYTSSAPTTPSRLSAFYQLELDNGDFIINNNNVNGNGKIKEEILNTNNGNKVVTSTNLFEARGIDCGSLVNSRTGEVVTKYGSRGRGRNSNKLLLLFSSSSSKRETRCLSPLRVSEHAWEEIEDEREVHKQSSRSRTRKWRFKDLFLFMSNRSASEGRASEKDKLKKHSFFYLNKKRSK